MVRPLHEIRMAAVPAAPNTAITDNEPDDEGLASAFSDYVRPAGTSLPHHVRGLATPVHVIAPDDAARHQRAPPPRCSAEDTIRATMLSRDRWFGQTVPRRVQLCIDTPFGKDNNDQSFTSDVRFRHSHIFLLESGFLAPEDETSLFAADPLAKQLDQLVRDHGDVDFRELRTYNEDWESETTIPEKAISQVTACMIHFKFDVASVVRYIGGTHIGAHRDTEKILDTLRDCIAEDVWHDLARLYRKGAPNKCNAHSSEENYQAFCTHGNHKSAEAEPAITRKALVKDHKKRFLLACRESIFPYLYNSHRTPIAIANVGHAYKKARFVFDSTRRPEHFCYAINDWTTKETEPELHFPRAFMTFLTWLWNLRISYPHEEIYPCDDDVAGAFRHGKYNPNLVAMHCVVIFGMTLLMTGMTFGDNTSPSNWEPIARARSQFAKWCWSRMDDLVEKAKPYAPTFTTAPAPTPEERAAFVQATPDSRHKGVFNEDGTRRPPPYPHHVDDNLYADVKPFLERTIAATVWSLYTVLGFPDPFHQDPLSHEKLMMHLTHLRNPVGRAIDTRRLTVGMTLAKRDILIAQLFLWLDKRTFTLLEIAQLYGLLSDAAVVCRWIWPRFFALRNALNTAIRHRHASSRGYAERAGLLQQFSASLPASVSHRLQGLVQREVAQFIWRNKLPIKMTNGIRSELAWLHKYLKNPANPWEISIGHLITRDPWGISAGDASHVGAGAINNDMRFFIDIKYLPETTRRMKLKRASNPDHLHINAGEFLIIIFQVAAIICKIETSAPGTYPPLLVYLIRTDNMSCKAWANKVAASSRRGQLLLQLFSELLRRADIGFNCEHIKGVDNIEPDFLSRINPRFTLEQRRTQILEKENRLQSWDCFLPNPKLISLVASKLSSDAPAASPALPKQLGHFAPASSTTICSFTI
jgi:hypothetical protein